MLRNIDNHDGKSSHFSDESAIPGWRNFKEMAVLAANNNLARQRFAGDKVAINGDGNLIAIPDIAG